MNLSDGNGKTHEKDIHYRMIVKYHSAKLCTSSIFKEDCPPHLTKLRTYLRNNSMIGVCIRGSLRTETHFQNLNGQLVVDRKDPPALAWYQANMKRPVIQKGMYLKAKDRPAISTSSRKSTPSSTG